MNAKKSIEEKIEQAMNSMNGHTRATCAPYLATRINAGLGLAKPISAWDKFYALITRPAIAMTCIVIILLLNIFIITSNEESETVRFQTEASGDWQGYSNVNTNAFYDVENLEP